MKKAVLILLTLAIACGASCALGELGFAEVNRDRVNLRERIGGERMAYLDQGHGVFVFEEKEAGGHLWCHVYTDVSKRSRDGWIRGDMLRFVSDEFHDVVSVQAGASYVTGLRADGTAAIMGNDAPHMPCIETVRAWRGVTQVTSGYLSVYALDGEQRILSVGRDSAFDVDVAARLCGDDPILLDEDGYVMPQTWLRDGEMFCAGYENLTDEIRKTPCMEAVGCERVLSAVLTKDGRLICTGAFETLKQHFMNGPYVDADAGMHHMLALRADGGVDAAVENGFWESEAGDVSGWKDVVKVAAGRAHSLGLREDGTVYYAGSDADHAWAIAHWTDVVDIDAGNDFSIGLKKDGSVVMAGKHDGYNR